MPGNRDTQFIQTEMSDDDIEHLLESQGYGFAAVCDDGEPYSIPISYGYDGEHVYLPFLITGDDATKTDFVEAGSTVRFLVTEVHDLFNWQSVTVTDEVAPVDQDSEEWDHFIEVLVRQDWFRPEFEQSESIETVQGWKLGLDDLEGVERRTFAYE